MNWSKVATAHPAATELWGIVIKMKKKEDYILLGTNSTSNVASPLTLISLTTTI